jgi:hypothetical protein
MTKQTAANNPALARIKKLFNAKIYKLASVTLNEKGEDAMRKHMQRYYRPEFDAKQLIMSENI